MAFLNHLHRVMMRQNLTAADARDAMACILAGDATTAQIAAFLAALRVKGETGEELLGFARAMRASAVRIEHGITDRVVLDTCGTGGDQKGTLNVSTLVALVASACGVVVAKHGNRSVSSRCGSADLLEALGVTLLTDPALIARSIREVGFGFLFAPALHPAMKNVMPARNELKTRTVMNLLGPLTNPAQATAQLLGAPSVEAAELMAVSLAGLGVERGIVVHGADGLDEASTTGKSHIFAIVRGAIDHRVVSPSDFGLPVARLEDLVGGEPELNRRIAEAVLDGEQGPARDIVLMNTALALQAAGVTDDPLEGVRRAAECLDTGATRRKLAALVEFTRSVGSAPRAV
jgi:anthranilate phosphoribosyltransferase